MGISPVQVAALTLTSGLVTGGYFTYQALVPSTLEEHLKKLNVELISRDWAIKEDKYKKAQETDLIPSISKGDGKSPITNFASNLQSWCEKKKTKYFLGETDLTYKRFSLWCTTNQTISNVLGGRNLKALDDVKKQAKVTAYNQLADGEKFITITPSRKDKTLQTADLDKWCTDEKVKEYQHEADENFKRIIEWCYSK